MKRSNKVYSKGMTLVEIVVAIAILGIITLSMLTLLSFSFRNIMATGVNSKAQYVTQNYMENTLAVNMDGTPPENTIISSKPQILTITFGGIQLSVNGKIDTILYDDGKNKVELATFVPDQE